MNNNVGSIAYLHCMQVKMMNWVDGKKGDMYNGMTAKFGSSLPDKADQTRRAPAVLSKPSDCCSTLTSKVPFPFTFIN